MLSRTADHLFWMSRYMERAENTARMLDVNYQTSLLPQSADAAEQGWRGLLSIRELTPAYQQALRRGQRAATSWTSWCSDESNPSSILACLRAARENARAVRGTLTTEVWETQNQTWLEFNRLLRDRRLRARPGQLLRMGQVPLAPVARRDGGHDAAGRGAALPAHRHLPRARRQHRAAARREVPCAGRRVLRQRPTTKESQEVDFYHWSAILRSVSGFEIYRKVYRNVIRPEQVAELLILRPDMPRSLAACMNEVLGNLKLVANEQSGETLRRAGRLQRRPAVRPHRRDPGHRPARLPDAVPGRASATWAAASAATSWCPRQPEDAKTCLCTSSRSGLARSNATGGLICFCWRGLCGGRLISRNAAVRCSPLREPRTADRRGSRGIANSRFTAVS